jgi:DNA (cytosine-5)-methyltransferase 1
MIDLFSGIGGFSLAARWTGQIETVAFVEIDPFCQKVLKKHWPTVPIISDIREVTGERIRGIVTDTTQELLNGTGGTGPGWRAEPTDCHIDILTGGFPCQPFSCAGKRKGTADNRFLWPEMLRVIREVRPRWVIGENVSGLISIDNGMVFEDCCASLEDEGYAVQPFVIPACAVNAPHRRDRIWIVAHNSQLSGYGEHRTSQTVEDSDRTHNGLSQQTDSHAPDTECGEQLPGYENGSILREGGTREVNSGDIVDAPDTDLPRSQGRDEHGERTGERATWQGHTEQWAEDWYTVALRTCVRNLDDGLPGRMVGRHRVNKLKALGNAIVPQVAYEILKAIIEAEKTF